MLNNEPLDTARLARRLALPGAAVLRGHAAESYETK